MKKRNAILLIAAIAVIALGIGSTISYFTSSDSGRSVFAVGKVKIEVTEDSWDPEAEHVITAGAVFDKDPEVLNKGSQDCYVRVKVKVSRVELMKQAGVTDPEVLFTADGTGFDGSKWQLSGTPEEDTAADTITYTYLYKDKVKAGSKTDPIFTKVKFPLDIDTSVIRPGLAGKTFVISVSADAVQSKTFASAEEAFAAIDN